MIDLIVTLSTICHLYTVELSMILAEANIQFIFLLKLNYWKFTFKHVLIILLSLCHLNVHEVNDADNSNRLW